MSERTREAEGLAMRLRKIAADDGCCGEGPNHCHDGLTLEDWCHACVARAAAGELDRFRSEVEHVNQALLSACRVNDNFQATVDRLDGSLRASHELRTKVADTLERLAARAAHIQPGNVSHHVPNLRGNLVANADLLRGKNPLARAYEQQEAERQAADEA